MGPKMYRLIFWNLNGKPLTNLVAEIAIANGADAIILAECSIPDGAILNALQTTADTNFFIPDCISETRFRCFCRDSALDLAEVHNGLRTSVRKLCLGSTTALLGVVHGLDIRNYDAESRQSVAQHLADEIRFIKTEQNNHRLIIMGDFNMNPYDRAMNLPLGLNAMMTKACIERGQRTFQGRQYDFYYNPMWSLFGDGSDGPAGTYYDTSNQGPYGWSMLDQVIINYSIISGFHSVRILTHAGNHSLIDARGRPDRITASDHLPIMVELKELNYD